MINHMTGEVVFQTGFHISPHCSYFSLWHQREGLLSIKTQQLSLEKWKRHVFGLHASEHGTFELEALSVNDHINVVLLSHSHEFYEPNTPGDAERRVFHEGVISTDLGGQREFS
jgi:hypothetical protein